MSSSAKKRRLERYFLNRVLSSGAVAHHLHRVDDGESPDFILRYESGDVGVEVTGLFHPPQSKGSRPWEGDCEQVLSVAQELWKAKGLPPIHAGVLFDKNTSFTRDTRSEMAATLVGCVLEALPSDQEHGVVGPGGPLWGGKVVEAPSGVRFITISRLPLDKETWWSLQTGGALPSLTTEDIQKTLDAKEALLPTYRKKVQTLWLIIGLELRFSSSFAPEVGALHARYASGFDRVFLVPQAEEAFYELKVCRSWMCRKLARLRRLYRRCVNAFARRPRRRSQNSRDA